ncbi:MAG: LPS export ABC transporter periplasmic protein LptC [Ignavibacteriales bacterium CG_4_9_14_3_um_filter_30_11]|nr:MAG: LPS export ABC transporter periplasmic protein LptC [Ignavibacteriales bacterium CG_4_9_14_3_um_filter_30_11]
MKKSLYFFLILLFTSSSCNDPKVKPTIDLSLDVKNLPSQESWNSKVIFSDSGITKAILYAGHLRVFEKGQETLMDDNVKVNFYNHDFKITSVITSKRGRVDDVTKDLYAIDSVVAVSDSGTVVTTDELLFRDKDKKILSDKFVTIVSKTETIKGYGFISDQDLQNYVVYNITYISKTDSTNGK